MTRNRFEPACAHLADCDPVMAELIARIGVCRLKPTRTYFVALLESIVWQQISWSAARAIYGRLLETVGTRYPKPGEFLRMSTRELLATGLSRRKVEYVLELSEYFESKCFPHRTIKTLGNEEIIAELTGVRGIGRWSAEMFLIFGLVRLDVFPTGDLGLRKAIERYYEKRRPTGEEALVRIAERWRPYRTVATWYLWAGMDGTPLPAGRG